VGVWQTDTGKEVRRFPLKFKAEAAIAGLAFSASGKQIVVATPDRKVRTCEVGTGKEVKAFTIPRGKDELRGLQFSPDGRLALTWEQATATKWVSERIELGGGRFEVRATQKKVPVGNPTLRLWDVEAGTQLGAQEVEQELSRCAFSRDGRRLLLVGGKNDARVWEVGKAGAASGE
jgi:WD40 repeat protein